MIVNLRFCASMGLLNRAQWSILFATILRSFLHWFRTLCCIPSWHGAAFLTQELWSQNKTHHWCVLSDFLVARAVQAKVAKRLFKLTVSSPDKDNQFKADPYNDCGDRPYQPVSEIHENRRLDTWPERKAHPTDHECLAWDKLRRMPDWSEDHAQLLMWQGACQMRQDDQEWHTSKENDHFSSLDGAWHTCVDLFRTCAYTFSFKHHLALSNMLASKIGNIKILRRSFCKEVSCVGGSYTINQSISNWLNQFQTGFYICTAFSSHRLYILYSCRMAMSSSSNQALSYRNLK